LRVLSLEIARINSSKIFFEYPPAERHNLTYY